MSAYLDARVSLMAARLLREGDAGRLIDGGEDACRALLRHAGLSQLLDDIDARRYLERSIIHVLLDEFRILNRASGEAGGFLIHWARRFELTNLKALLRSRLTHDRVPAQAERARAELIDLGPFATLPLDDLLRSEDASELLRRLASTPYADMARHARGALEKGRRMFELDAALDRRYYQQLALHARPLEKRYGEPFARLVRDLIDSVNLVWLLRYRFAYRLASAEVYYLLVPGGRLGGGTLKYLSRLATFEEVLAALPMPWHDWLLRARTPHDVSCELDRRAREGLREVLRSPTPACARAFAYLRLRENDLRAVRSVLKGRAMGLDAATIRASLGVEGDGATRLAA